MRRVLLLRHGEYPGQFASGYFFKSELSEKGKRQAELTGTRLAEMANPPVVIHSSTMRRAEQSAEIIAEKLPGVSIHCSSDLCECEQSQIPPPANQSLDESNRFRMYDDDGLLCYEGRVSPAPGPEAAFARLFGPLYDSDTELIVCHGSIICYFLARIEAEKLWRRMAVPNCAITTVHIEPDGRLELVSLAVNDHLTTDDN